MVRLYRHLEIERRLFVASGAKSTIALLQFRSFVLVLTASLASGACARREVHMHPVLDRTVHAPPNTDVANYVLEARLDDAHRVITGSERIVWRNASDRPTSLLWWHLYMNAFDGPDTLFMRSGGAGGHRGHTPGDRGRIDVTSLRLSTGEDLLASSTPDEDVPRDRTQLRTPLPRAVAPGESITIDVVFRTALPAAFARTGFFDDFVFAAQWFPKLAVLERDGTWAHFPFHANTEFYADFGRYEATITVPHDNLVGACGVEISPAQSVPTGDRHQFVAEHVHDFAWTAWASFRETWRTIDGVAIRVLAPPGLGAVIDRTFASLEHAMPVFRSRYGRYPYPQLTVVIPPRGAGGIGGMEYPTLITTEGQWFLPSSVHDVEWVTVHEFAHQYFYGLFASNEWAWPMLDEGIAEYTTGRVLTEWFGPGREMFDGLGLSFGYNAFEGGFSGGIDDAIPVASGSSQFPSYRDYGDHVYRRTAAVFASAERLFGRTRVDHALANYALNARFAHPTPTMLFDSVGKSDAPIAVFLRRALVADGALDDAIASVSSRPSAQGWTTSIDVRHAGALDAPRTLAVEFADGSTRSRSIVGRSETLSVLSNTPALAARIDPIAPLPIDRNRLDDARLANAARAPSDVAITARFAFWLEVLFRMVGP